MYLSHSHKDKNYMKNKTSTIKKHGSEERFVRLTLQYQYSLTCETTNFLAT